jgi:hypothetical protein
MGEEIPGGKRLTRSSLSGICSMGAALLVREAIRVTFILIPAAKVKKDCGGFFKDIIVKRALILIPIATAAFPKFCNGYEYECLSNLIPVLLIHSGLVAISMFTMIQHFSGTCSTRNSPGISAQ